MTTLTQTDHDEIEAQRDRAATQAVAGLRAAIAEALKMLGHARRHLGALVDELYDVEYAEDTAGTDLGETIDQAAALIRSAERTAELLRGRSAPTPPTGEALYCSGCGAFTEDPHRAGCRYGEGCPVGDPVCETDDGGTHDGCVAPTATRVAS